MTNLSSEHPRTLGDYIPWPDDDSWPNIDPEKAFELFLEWTLEQGIELWPHQEEALMSLMVDDHVILGTPTGSGKSLVAIGMCFLSVCTNRRAYYTAPIKALVSEKFFQLCDTFGRENVGMITGDAAINSDAPIICCTAEILAMDALREGSNADIGCVAMDEFHFFADPDRGWAWQVPLLCLPYTQFLLMSATLGDTTEIRNLLDHQTDRSVSALEDAPRPVPLTFEWSDQTLEGTVELALRKGDAPLYLVHFAQDAALKSAQGLSSFGISQKEDRERIKEAIRGTRFTTAFGQTLRRLLLSGVGVHHAGMLPRYRLLVEKLAQQGLLPVICGTDTLGVGINVPIHTVVLTALTKYDGSKMRRLNAREFHQIAGRAGRSGFDTEGVVIAQATEYDIEKARALAKAGGDVKKARQKMAGKKAPQNVLGWTEDTFRRLETATPTPLRPRLRVTHAMVIAQVMQGGNAKERMHELIGASMQQAEEKLALLARADEIFTTLETGGVIDTTINDQGNTEYFLTVDMPEDFALDQPLSPFLLAALELLDPESETYELDVISLVESTLENPRQILMAQERQAKDAAMGRMKAEGVPYEERMERIEEVTYPQPLRELLDAAFETYLAEVPWARDYELFPKSILRDMIEIASDFKGYIARLGIARSEGLLLRYLSDAYRVLDRTIPETKRSEALIDITAWLKLVVRSVDSSLIDEWAGTATAEIETGAAPGVESVVGDRRALTVLVRNALFTRVRLIAERNARALGELDGEAGFSAARWEDILDRLYDDHEYISLDADARSRTYFTIDERDEISEHVWHVEQILHDSDEDHDYRIWADVDLDATQEAGEVIFASYRAGCVDENVA